MTIAPRRGAPNPRELLVAYQAVIAEIDRLPRVLWVRRRTGRLGGLLRVPRLRFFVRFFVLYHVNRSLVRLRRLYNSGAALQPEDASFESGARQIDAFERSLPPHRPRLMLVCLLLSVFLVSSQLARRVVPDFDLTLTSVLNLSPDDQSELADSLRPRVSAEPLEKMASASLTLSPGDATEAFKSFACTELRRSDGTFETACSVRRGVTNTVSALIFLGVAIWLVTALPITSFRLKRMLFNLQTGSGRRLSAELALAHVAKARGIYHLEERQFRALGARPPREIPLDLLSQAGILVLPIWVGVLLVAFAGWAAVLVLRDGFFEGDATVIASLLSAGAVVFALPGARLASLRRVYARRLADAARAYTAETFVEERAAFRRRAVAHLLDAIVVTILWAAIAVTVWRFETSFDARWLAIFLGPALAWLAYLSLLLVRGPAHRGQTLGKQVLGLRVVRSNGEPVGVRRLFFREAVLKGYLFGPASLALLGLPLLLDYLFPLGHHRNRALHDLIADTLVVREVRAEAAVGAPSALAH